MKTTSPKTSNAKSVKAIKTKMKVEQNKVPLSKATKPHLKITIKPTPQESSKKKDTGGTTKKSKQSNKVYIKKLTSLKAGEPNVDTSDYFLDTSSAETVVTAETAKTILKRQQRATGLTTDSNVQVDGVGNAVDTALAKTSKKGSRTGTDAIKPEDKVKNKKKVTQRKASKRGENEDSEVRYDTKHILKKQKKSKGGAGTDNTESSMGEEEKEDTNSVVSGNEDDQGSVVSAILDEDICYECGRDTLNGSEWGEVVLCDLCEGEYHLQCQGLSCTPEGEFHCTKCLRDEQHFKDMDFEVSSSFKIPLRPEGERSVVYSPAKPLELAWQEGREKGLMVVAQVFTPEIMSKLTHGLVQKVLRSGRVAESWLGATREVAKRVSATSCHDIIDRNGRYDLRLPDFVIDQLGLVAALQPILDKLETCMGSPRPQLRTHNVVFVPVGSDVQEWHVDDSMVQRKHHRYFTVLINLNPLDAYCGGTEVWIDKLKRGDLVRARPGDALVFTGSLLHRGHANNGYMHRFFYYASFACGADANTGAA